MQSFSVLLSLYYKENADFLRHSLDSIFNQTVPPNEVVLVLDGPLTTELETVVMEYKAAHQELKTVPLKKNGGLGKALNEGLKHCSNELVARMDTDDIAHNDRFEKQLEAFRRFPQVEVVSAWIDEFIGETEHITSTRKLPEFPYEIYKYAKKRCPVNHPVVMFRKNSILLAGGYRHFPLFEDYYLWIRLLLNGVKFYNVQESLLSFRTSPDMYKRRGGWKHAFTEVHFQNHIRKLGFIGWPRMCLNIAIRFSTRIMPNHLREIVYKNLLRR
jgi:glycosyltransferase involved in cell wall biosynthesis